MDRLRWVFYQDRINNLNSGLRMVPQDHFFPDGEPEQMPEVYVLYRRCKTHNVLWAAGGMENQPHLLMLQFDECALAEDEFTSKHMPSLIEQDKRSFGQAQPAAGDWRSLLREE